MATSRTRLFLREFRRTYRTTGALLPSGRALCQALSRIVRETDGPKRILEVGPGTGVVTARIVEAMGPDDRLDLVELNERFVACLDERFQDEESFRRVADQATIMHRPVEDLLGHEPYDMIVSGLPLNNFSVEEVEGILSVLTSLVREGGVLSFFEYIAIRRIKGVLSGSDDRRRLGGISLALDRLFRENSTQHERILPNVPPAWVHHVRMG